MPKFAEFQGHEKEAKSLLADALGRNGADFARDAAMFMPGKAGLAASAVMGALDNAHGNSGHVAAEMASGALKGMANYELTSRLMVGNEHVLFNGITLGVSSRFINQVLDYRTYTSVRGDKVNFDPDFFDRFGSVFSSRALASDLALGAAGAVGLKATSRLGLDHLRESKLASTVMTGSIYGFVSGGTTAAMQEKELSASSIKMVGGEALRGGMIAGSAAVFGGLGRALTRGTHINEAVMVQDKQNFARLGRPEIIQKDYLEPIPEYKIKTDTDWKNFYNYGTRTASENLLLYRPENQAPFMVQAGYAFKLNQIRALREQAMGHLGADSLGVLGARLKLDLHPYRDAALPEALLPHMASVPDRSMFRDVHLQERYGLQSYFDLKRGQASNPSAEVQTATNTMWIYKPKQSQDIGNDMRHEWSHIARNTDSRAATAFDHAAVLEHGGWNKRSYAETNFDENWAVNMGELMLEPSAPASHFEYMTIMAPVRSAVMGKSLGARLNVVAPENRSEHHDLFVSRVEHIRSQVQPRAEESLEKLLKSGDESVRKHAAAVLDYLRS